jgi:hypothetical protein
MLDAENGKDDEMTKIETIMNEVEKFESDMMSVALVLDGLKTLNEDYAASISAPHAVMTSLQEFHTGYTVRLDDLDHIIQRLVADFKQYDVLIKEAIQAESHLTTTTMLDRFDSSLEQINVRHKNAISELNEQRAKTVSDFIKVVQSHTTSLNDTISRIQGALSQIDQTNQYFRTHVEESNRNLAIALTSHEETTNQLKQVTTQLMEEYSTYHVDNTKIIDYFRVFTPRHEMLVKDMSRFKFQQNLNTAILCVVVILGIIATLGR